MSEVTSKFIAVVIIAVVVALLMAATVWGQDLERNQCRGQGGTPVMWHNQVQCVFPGGAPLH